MKYTKIPETTFQNLQDDTDPNIKRRYINVTAEYLTLN